MHLIPSNIAVIKVLISQLTRISSRFSSFQASSKTPPRPLQDPSKMPPQEIPSAASAEVDQISRLLEQMILDDPYLRAMHEGKMKWGDLMLLYEKENPKPKKQEPEILCNSCKSTSRCYCGYPEEPAPKVAPAVAPTVEDCGICTLRLGNLPRDISVQELKSIFSAHGTVRDVHIPKNMDRSSPYFGTIRGFAMVEFDKSWEATNALTAVYGLTIRTKKITCEFAKSDRKRPDQMAAMGGAGGPATGGAPPARPPPPAIRRETAQGSPAIPAYRTKEYTREEYRNSGF